MRPFRLGWLLVLAVGLAACAKKPPVVPGSDPAFVTAMAEADALVLQGCYDCLVEARTTYRRVAIGPERPLVAPRLFETNVLIVLREGELSLDQTAAMAEARQIAQELPPALEADRFLRLASAVPPEPVATPHAVLAEFRKAHDAFVPTLEAELTWLENGPLQPAFRGYLALALDCGYINRPRTGPRPQAGPRLAPAGAPPLIVYRTSICDFLAQPGLYRVRADNARFVEASYFLARFDVAVAQQMGPGHARERLAESGARFPESPAISYISGVFQQLIGNCDAALSAFDRTIALKPAHENAWMGRTMCLSHLKRHQDAIEAATHIIDANFDNTSEGYYWRSWNKHVLKDLEAARADINKAKTLSPNGEVLTLAGIIESDQDDLNAAETDLERARNVPGGAGNCTAMWFLGIVQVKRVRAMEAGKQFEDAMGCYERAAALAEVTRLTLEQKNDIDPEWKASQLAALGQTTKEAMAQHYAAAFNAANYYASGGNIAGAKRLVVEAAKDPSLLDQVTKLREWLKDKYD